MLRVDSAAQQIASIHHQEVLRQALQSPSHLM
jgi:hypothetical protein